MKHSKSAPTCSRRRSDLHPACWSNRWHVPGLHSECCLSVWMSLTRWPSRNDTDLILAVLPFAVASADAEGDAETVHGLCATELRGAGACARGQ